jgi:hypothetical protein
MPLINEQSAATVERFIERLEFRAKDPTFTAYREAYPELLEPTTRTSRSEPPERDAPVIAQVRATPF